MVRFHLDEHGSRALAEGLRRLGIDITMTHEAGLSGATDEEQLAYCLKTERVIFTQDYDYLKLHAAGRAHAGIAYSHQQRRTLRELIEGLRLVWEIHEAEDMRGHVEYLLTFKASIDEMRILEDEIGPPITAGFGRPSSTYETSSAEGIGPTDG